MFCSAIKTSGSKGCVLPTVVRTFTANATPSSFNIGTASEERIIIVSVSRQGVGTTYTLTLNGQAPLTVFNGNTTFGGNACFAIWKVPTGTTATFTSSDATQPISVYAIYGWSDYKVIQFNSFAGGDSNDWSFTASPIPANSIILGTWSTNEDGGAENKLFNFGESDRYFYGTGAHDGGSAYEVITEYNAAKSIVGDTAGKRRSFGFLSISCINSAV